VTLTPAQANQAATLSLGPIDDFDLTWVNGRTIGSSAFEARKYPLPAKLLKAGDNLIVVNVLDTYANGGMYGPAAKRTLEFADGSSVPLPDWEYQIAPAGMANPPRAPWEATAGGSMLYNGMIAPLGKFGLRGVVWYQGESNATVPDGKRYEAQLRTLMADWRRQFAAPLPFLVVQLPNYGALAKAPVESGWALTREAVRRAVAADGNAGLVVTYDLGNRDDVHPTNKQDVGRRLSRAARHVVFGEPLSAWGAQPESARRDGGNVVVSFGAFEGELVVYNAKDPAAFELCGAAAGTCKFVSARLTGGSNVTLDAADVPEPTRVRFCWADSPLCNLYDTAGLPVGPFEIPVGAR
jgi:sialate O-acetylesterase